METNVKEYMLDLSRESSNFSKDFSNKVSETLFVNFNSDLFNSGSLRSFLIYFLRSQSRMSGKFLTIVI
jgi:hypothetical protein